ncbi:MAG: hypothetical protein IKE55_01425 [Kiritimatiellae bacterium]|nr:hypothetical protein [Kiritimatiellia bacterium]
MSTTLTLPSVRFTAQVNTGAPEAKANYKALAQRNAIALEGCPWREAAADTIKPSLVEHSFTATFTDEKYDAFCMTGSYDSTANTEVAYAGMVAYRFKLPQAYLAGSTSLESASVMLARDRFLLPGLRVSAVLSDSASPSDDWSVVRGDAEGCVKLVAQLANPANRITAAEQATGAVALELAGLDTTKKTYLWIYLTVEDYQATWTWYSSTQHRLYAIEGSGMIISQSSSVTFDGDVAPDVAPTTLKLVNLATKATDATIALSGPVHSMVPLFLDRTGSDHGCRYAVITGDFDEYSVSGMPGLVVYDFVNRAIASVSEVADHEVPATVKAAWRRSGVKAHLASPVRIEFMCDYAPVSCFAKAIIEFRVSTSTGAVSAYYDGAASIDLTPSAEAADISVMHNGDALFSIYQDRIDISGKGSDDRRLPKTQVPFSGAVSGICAPVICNGGAIIICGNNSVGDNKAAVKLLFPSGHVVDYFADLTPDNFADFMAYDFVSDGCSAGFTFGSYLDNAATSFSTGGGSLQYTSESSGFRLVTKDGKTDPEIIEVAQQFGYSFGGSIGTVLTGRFKSIGGLRANGAAILMYNAENSTLDCQMSLVPLDVGPMKRGVVFVDSNSPLPLRVSHMLIEPVS